MSRLGSQLQSSLWTWKYGCELLSPQQNLHRVTVWGERSRGITIMSRIQSCPGWVNRSRKGSVPLQWPFREVSPNCSYFCFPLLHRVDGIYSWPKFLPSPLFDAHLDRASWFFGFFFTLNYCCQKKKKNEADLYLCCPHRQPRLFPGSPCLPERSGSALTGTIICLFSFSVENRTQGPEHVRQVLYHKDAPPATTVATITISSSSSPSPPLSSLLTWPHCHHITTIIIVINFSLSSLRKNETQTGNFIWLQQLLGGKPLIYFFNCRPRYLPSDVPPNTCCFSWPCAHGASPLMAAFSLCCLSIFLPLQPLTRQLKFFSPPIPPVIGCSHF